MALPSSAEIRSAIKGLGLLLRGDDRVLLCYDLSLDGFWRSFWLPLALLVAYVLIMRPEAAELAAYDGDITYYMLLQALKFLLGWAAYFALIGLVSRMFGLSQRFGIFVILYNWAQAITTAATLPILAAVTWDLLPVSVLAGWSTALLLAWLYIVARIGRHGLGGTWPLAITLSSLDLLVTLVAHRLVDLLL